MRPSRKAAAQSGRTGVGVLANGDHWYAHAVLTGATVNNTGDFDEQTAAIARVAFNPIYSPDYNVHIGANFQTVFDPADSVDAHVHDTLEVGAGLCREAFVRHAVELGPKLVSGLARGIDSAAHEAALEAGGATIAVLGSGVDCPWPAGPLAERMALEGLLLSEYAPGTAPRRHHFPERNRLISGLCSAVVVIEAAAASGSLITARWAIDQGRSVHALPGRVDHPMARGCHRLLREGAWLVEDPEEVLARLGTPFNSHGKKRHAGLGLYHCHQVAELHGGSLRLRRLAPRGTEAELELSAALQA